MSLPDYKVSISLYYNSEVADINDECDYNRQLEDEIKIAIKAGVLEDVEKAAKEKVRRLKIREELTEYFEQVIKQDSYAEISVPEVIYLLELLKR